MEWCVAAPFLAIAGVIVIVYAGAKIGDFLAKRRIARLNLAARQRVQRPTQPPRRVEVPVEARERAQAERVCPFCKDTLGERSVHIECATCSTWHHATCFEENGGCSVFGCREQRGRGVAGERTT